MSNLLLTKEQLDDVRGLQKRLDDRIVKEKGLEGKDLSLEKHIALKTELFEFINEVASFKFWKENKPKAHVLEEACDTLHFVMSLAIDNDVEIKSPEMQDSYNADNYDTNELFGMMDAITLDCYMDKDYDDLNVLLLLMCIVLDKCGFNANDLYKSYIKKNKVNHGRQDRKY